MVIVATSPTAVRATPSPGERWTRALRRGCVGDETGEAQKRPWLMMTRVVEVAVSRRVAAAGRGSRDRDRGLRRVTPVVADPGARRRLKATSGRAQGRQHPAPPPHRCVAATSNAPADIFFQYGTALARVRVVVIIG